MGKKVLIADDDPNSVIPLELLMRREGFEVEVAHDGLQALAAIRSGHPQLVLLDVTMPGKTGFEVCAEVRADDSLAGTRIVFVSASGREGDVARGLGLGADAYVTKPFVARELIERVHQVLP